MGLPGLYLHQLKGRQAERWSVRVRSKVRMRSRLTTNTIIENWNEDAQSTSSGRSAQGVMFWAPWAECYPSSQGPGCQSKNTLGDPERACGYQSGDGGPALEGFWYVRWELVEPTGSVWLDGLLKSPLAKSRLSVYQQPNQNQGRTMLIDRIEIPFPRNRDHRKSYYYREKINLPLCRTM